MNPKYITLSPIFIICFFSFAQELYKKDCKLMGVDYKFSVVANSVSEGTFFLQEAVNEVERIEQLISSWKDSSQTSLINKNAGIKAVKVDNELYNLIKRCIRISELTDGYFDISFSSIDKIWYFHEKIFKIPDSNAVKESVRKIDYTKIILNSKESSVFLKEKGMKIGFGAIGKGYAAEKTKEKLQKLGLSSGLINASGDIRCWGNHPKTVKWKIGITNPQQKESYSAWFDLLDSAVVTSGNYEKYVSLNGEKYTHIINPKTGWPVKGLQSVTIFCTNAELADALATAVFVMGKKEGIKLINQLKDIECLLIDDTNKIYFSNTLKNNNTNNEG